MSFDCMTPDLSGYGLVNTWDYGNQRESKIV
jgi:hypothetical protein